MKVKFSRLAAAEVDEAHAWYGARQRGLGDAFREEVAFMVELIGEQPEMCAIVFAHTRRAMLRRFPYFLLYEVFPEVVVVFGVIHGARDPNFWIGRRAD